MEYRFRRMEETRKKRVAGSKQIMQFTGWNWLNTLRWWHLKGSRKRLAEWGKQAKVAVSELVLSCRWAQSCNELWVTVLGHLGTSEVLQSPTYWTLEVKCKSCNNPGSFYYIWRNVRCCFFFHFFTWHQIHLGSHIALWNLCFSLCSLLTSSGFYNIVGFRDSWILQMHTPSCCKTRGLFRKGLLSSKFQVNPSSHLLVWVDLETMTRSLIWVETKPNFNFYCAVTLAIRKNMHRDKPPIVMPHRHQPPPTPRKLKSCICKDHDLP